MEVLEREEQLTILKNQLMKINGALDVFGQLQGMESSPETEEETPEPDLDTPSYKKKGGFKR